jgi:hypothetical protein
MEKLRKEVSFGKNQINITFSNAKKKNLDMIVQM